MPRARLLFLVILAYATVLNFFVFKLYLHNHPAVLEKSLDGLQKIKQRRLEGLNRHKTMPAKPPHPDIEPNCAATQSVIAIVNTKSHPIPGRKNQISPLLSRLRDILGPHPMPVILIGSNDTLTQTQAIWCSSVHIPCTTLFLPPETDLTDIHKLTEPLLRVTPCIDDLVILQASLRIDHMFLQSIRRSTQSGKVTCLHQDPHLQPLAPDHHHLPYCPSLAYRLPRSFLWQILDEGKGDLLALAGERGMLGTSVSLVRT